MDPTTSCAENKVKTPEETGPSKKQILLYIEDNSTNRELVRYIIDHRSGLIYLEAENGRQGLEMGKCHHPDLILLDIHLPDMDGFTVLRHLKSDPETADIPVIALTGSTTAADIRKASEIGFTKFLSKPINIKEFNSALDAALND